MDTGRSARVHRNQCPESDDQSAYERLERCRCDGTRAANDVRPPLQHRLVQLDGAVRDGVPAEFAHCPLPAG